MLSPFAASCFYLVVHLSHFLIFLEPTDEECTHHDFCLQMIKIVPIIVYVVVIVHDHIVGNSLLWVDWLVIVHHWSWYNIAFFSSESPCLYWMNHDLAVWFVTDQVQWHCNTYWGIFIEWTTSCVLDSMQQTMWVLKAALSYCPQQNGLLLSIHQNWDVLETRQGQVPTRPLHHEIPQLFSVRDSFSDHCLNSYFSLLL